MIAESKLGILVESILEKSIRAKTPHVKLHKQLLKIYRLLHIVNVATSQNHLNISECIYITITM